ncbi:hypothetical protein [Helicobacter cetorum]|uniref:Septum formation initiator n=1 Tax=Helicobacter cetorum (strain ATCC BAA-540 / CCUG 52418 / MIT 99-5656) TaxID=1163745 RepID=I0ERS8_HELCM|nr:hypothetical protein [Helicobacter cetorum]AFI05647.1 hypothetical protein HCD_03155 [Helicobacter cetorum MIT 99-5656]
MVESLFESDVLKDNKARDFFYSNRSLIVFFLLLLGFGYYLGNLLFGVSSLETYLDLKDKHKHLQQEITELQSKNARLQKRLFELRELRPRD